MLSDKKQELVSESSGQLNALGINHTIDICGTITVQTKQGKVIYYPTKNKIQYKGTVTAGGLNNVKNLVDSLGLSGEIAPQKNKPDEITLRDYFAARAMGAGIRRYDGSKFGGGQNAPDYEYLAVESYHIADAMMKARQNDSR
ncbi:hypothetical protein XBJ1_1177 [Xenorhabdus bovienii SS-2004]|uniref:Uncharacterized protein n=2 Tax=Xenorhabdus bovienii TaxID=40576 RepID=D3V018_XENBS|nr:hypothetical protein [Xenorhabdus bovienii]CBJ80311.1 hypothetical protein XBJ1_1177 [Xenorhabdus bovienii SS-2004]